MVDSIGVFTEGYHRSHLARLHVLDAPMEESRAMVVSFLSSNIKSTRLKEHSSRYPIAFRSTDIVHYLSGSNLSIPDGVDYIIV